MTKIKQDIADTIHRLTQLQLIEEYQEALVKLEALDSTEKCSVYVQMGAYTVGAMCDDECPVSRKVAKQVLEILIEFFKKEVK